MRRLWLASKSPRRSALLSSLGFPFSVEEAHVEELESASRPEEVPRFNALRKAEAVAIRHPEDLVIGADTVILFQGKVIGKPHNQLEAEQLLLAFSGKSHLVVTGLAVICYRSGFCRNWLEYTEVFFKRLTRRTVKYYLELVSVLDKAGAYALQEHGDMLIERVDGDPDNVVGLPLKRLYNELSVGMIR